MKFKKEGTTILKILDISQKCLFKRSLSTEELRSFGFQPSAQTPFKIPIRKLLEILVQKQLLPPEHFSTSSSKPISLEDCQQTTAQAIQQYKPKVVAEHREIEGFCCPLTFDVFREPVMDEHGHTFEKSIIEEHLKRDNQCPISREPIRSLVPNRLVQQTIEEYQRKEPIPNFSLFKKDNPKLVSNNLELAQNYLQEGEYTEAIDSYTKALQYTKDWRHYVGLPILFKKMQQAEKALLANLYLAYYQLQDGKIYEAIQTLETCREEKATPRHIDLLLIQLYELSNQSQKAFQLAQKTAEVVATEHPEQAIVLYRQILNQNSQQFELYEPFSELLKSPQEKAHHLLKGACHALEAADYRTAKYLCEQAEKYSNNSFVDELLSLELLEQPVLTQKLTLLAAAYEQKKLPHHALRAYKMLFQFEEKAEYCEKIVAVYETLQKTPPQTTWYIRWLFFLIKKEDWPAAERVAQTALEKVAETEKISLYQTLETIYTRWEGNRLEDLWTKLGQAYQRNGQLEAAEQTYRKAYQRFHMFEHAIALADILNRQEKVQPSVQMYYEASSLALLDGKLERLDRCVRQMKEVDPRMQYLDTSQRIQLLTQRALLDLSRELQGTKEEVRLLKEKISLTEKERAKQEELEATRLLKVNASESKKIVEPRYSPLTSSPTISNDNSVESHLYSNLTPSFSNLYPPYISSGKGEHLLEQAKHYLFGMGMTIDISRAASLLLNLQDPEVLWMFGRCYEKGYYQGQAFVQNKEKAFQLYQTAYDRSQDPLAGFYIALCYEEGVGVVKNPAQAQIFFQTIVPRLKERAEAGDALAQNELGWCYDNGQGVPQDEKEAVRWYQKAADQGVAEAQYNLGSCYENGQGVCQNEKEAVRWYRKAADQGDANAQYNLGICYANGRGVRQNEQEAVRWYRKAADQGYAEAQYNLGQRYANGQGVYQNEKEAIKWYRKAADQEHIDAQKALENYK